MNEADSGLGEWLLDLLDQAATATTYKFALLLSIIDICMERPADDNVPFVIGVHELAEHVTERAPAA